MEQSTETTTIPSTSIPAPAVHCAFSEMALVNSLNPHPANPNRHPPKQIEVFMTILMYQGCRRAVTVSKRSGFVTKGHGLLEAYRQAGWEEIPIDYQDYENEEQELSDIVADNQLARMSEMDTRQLQEILVKLDNGAFNMELTGFDNVKLEKLFTGFGLKTGAPQFQVGEGIAADGASPSPTGAAVPLPPDANPGDGAPQPSHVRMVQLFFNEETQAEFMQTADYFARMLGTTNVTDTVLEVMRSAYRSHCADNNEQLPPGLQAEAATDPADAPTP